MCATVQQSVCVRTSEAGTHSQWTCVLQAYPPAALEPLEAQSVYSVTLALFPICKPEACLSSRSPAPGAWAR